MLDIRFIREHPDNVREGVRKKGEDPSRVDEILQLDQERRRLLQQSEALKSRKNIVSSEVARMKSKGDDASSLIAEMKIVSENIKVLDDELKAVDLKLASALLQVPNIPHPTVPVGKTPAENQVIATWGEEPVID